MTVTRYLATLSANAVLTVTCALNSEIELLLAQPASTGATTIAAGSDTAVLPQATINVASTTGFASSGTFTVVTVVPGGAPGLDTITYTGVTGTTFTGCTGGTGTLATGAAVSGAKTVTWQTVDRWLTPDQQPPVLTTTAADTDRIVFRNIGGLTYGENLKNVGANGANGANGALGVQNLGVWSSATTYAANDIVTYLGATYISRVGSNTNNTPVVAGTASWDPMAIPTGTPPPQGGGTEGGSTGGGPPPNSGTSTVSLDVAGAAGKLIMWGSLATSSNDFVFQTSAQLAAAVAVNVGGLALNTGLLQGMGGAEQWTGNGNDPLTGTAHTQQRAIRDNNFVAKARGVGLTKLYLGCYARNTVSPNAFWGDWWNDTLWTNTIIPSVTNFAAAAKLMGFDGLNIDNEGGSGAGNWAWNYAGNTHDQTTTRAKVKARGAQLMTAILSVFPNVEVGFYNMNPDHGLKALRGLVVSAGNYPQALPTSVQMDWLNGFSSVPGYARLRVWDDAYYTGTQLSGGVTQTTMCITTNASLAFFSQTFDNWNYANQRLSISPFLWIGPTNSTAEGHPNDATFVPIVQASRIFSMSGEWADYRKAANESPGNTSYAALANSYAAAVPGTTDTTDPTLSGITVTRRGSTGIVDVAGTADDNLGVRAVRWSTTGSSGACIHTWVPENTKVTNGVTTGDWTVAFASFGFHFTFTTVGTAGVPAAVGSTITLTVEDIKGRAVSYSAVAP